jgi:hypothetical protein
MLDKVRDFLTLLFPPQLSAYIPGRKLAAGVVLAVLANLGVDGEEIVNVPVIGDISVEALAFAVGVYLFPEKDNAVPEVPRDDRPFYDRGR